jgi:hypothetical protein
MSHISPTISVQLHKVSAGSYSRTSVFNGKTYKGDSWLPVIMATDWNKWNNQTSQAQSV